METRQREDEAQGLVRAELHTHSTASDGEHAPERVAAMCAEQGVRLWSLTDHDTLEGVREAAAAARAHGMRFIPGVEMSALSEGRSIHVLGYGLDPADPDLSAFLAERLELRRTRMTRMVARMNDLGVHVRLAHVTREAGGKTLARPHLAKALVRLGYVETVSAAFSRWLGDGKPGYVQSPWPSVPEAIARIHAAGGVAILAHPGHYDQDDHIPAWIEAGLDGIEVGHPGHKRHHRVRYLAMTEHFDLLRTESSDYHGVGVYPERALGKVALPHSWCDALLERLGEETLAAR